MSDIQTNAISKIGKASIKTIVINPTLMKTNLFKKQYIMLTTLMVSLLYFSQNVSAQEEYEKVGYTQEGKSSYYADRFHNRKTASGELFDMYAMTGAHPKIPFNSIVKVTNIATGKWVTVRINDRGPFTKTRIIDVSKAAALKLDMVKDGMIDVRIELLRVGGEAEEFSTANDTITAAVPVVPVVVTEPVKVVEEPKEEVIVKETPAETKTVEVIKPEIAKIEKPKEEVKPKIETKAKPEKEKTAEVKEKPKKAEKPKTEQPKKIETPKPEVPKIEKTVQPTVTPTPATPAKEVNKELADKFKPTNTYSIWGTPRLVKGWGIQIASYNDIETAINVGKDAMKKGFDEIYIQSGWLSGIPNYRVLYKASENQDDLRKDITQLKSKGFDGVFLKEHFQPK
jgi:rare lipoprotein A